jgi:hypothetical protein
MPTSNPKPHRKTRTCRNFLTFEPFQSALQHCGPASEPDTGEVVPIVGDNRADHTIKWGYQRFAGSIICRSSRANERAAFICVNFSELGFSK